MKLQFADGLYELDDKYIPLFSAIENWVAVFGKLGIMPAQKCGCGKSKFIELISDIHKYFSGESVHVQGQTDILGCKVIFWTSKDYFIGCAAERGDLRALMSVEHIFRKLMDEKRREKIMLSGEIEKTGENSSQKLILELKLCRLDVDLVVMDQPPNCWKIALELAFKNAIAGHMDAMEMYSEWPSLINKFARMSIENCWLDCVKLYLEKNSLLGLMDHGVCHLPKKHGHLDCFKYLFDKCIDKQWQMNGMCISAIENGHLDCLEYACGNGYAKMRYEKKCAMMHAAVKGNLEILNYLRGASNKINITVMNGFTSILISNIFSI